MLTSAMCVSENNGITVINLAVRMGIILILDFVKLLKTIHMLLTLLRPALRAA